jgi:hypothetical protein
MDTSGNAVDPSGNKPLSKVYTEHASLPPIPYKSGVFVTIVREGRRFDVL